jgi:prephenate dehydrogenase
LIYAEGVDVVKIGILGVGAVGKSFVDVLPKYGDHTIYAYDIDPARTYGLENVQVCGSEEEVGAYADFLLCCTDMLNGAALTKAARAMRSGTVVSGDFSAKTPEYGAVKASGRIEDLSYWSIHTTFHPKLGFDDQLIIEIPVRNCYDGKEHPHITEFRDTLERAGSRFKTIWSVDDHDKRMGRIQGATSAENICTAATLAKLGINPETDSNVYANTFDRTKFLMSLRAVGERGSSNSAVYGLIAMMNPYSRSNIDAYLETLEHLISAGKDSGEILEAAIDSLGYERVAEARRLWESRFGPLENYGNSCSSHLAEAVLWSASEYPLEIFAETPSPPYRMREIQALTALSDYQRCLQYMGTAHDEDFLIFVRRYQQWTRDSAGCDSAESSRAHLDKFEREFFTPVREAFPEELKNIGPRTNKLLKKIANS